MKIYRQKMFMSAKKRLGAYLGIAKSNLRFIGGLAGEGLRRVKETGNLMAIDKLGTVKRIASGFVNGNKETLRNIKNAATTVGGGNGATASKRLGVLANLALDLSPRTATAKTAVVGLHEAAGRSGKDVVGRLARVVNPFEAAGHIGAHAREAGHGGAALAGHWVGPGVNKWCLGAAPDTVASSIGNMYENYRGANNLGREAELIINSREGRRLARSYDRRVGKYLRPAHEAVSNIVSKVPETIDRTAASIREVFRRPRLGLPLQPQLVPVRAFTFVDKKEEIKDMKILREKIFGKLDAQEAAKLGITVKELRQRRSALSTTGTVLDSINVKARAKDPKIVNKAAAVSYKNGKVGAAINESSATGVRRFLNDAKERILPGSQKKRIVSGGYDTARGTVEGALNKQNELLLGQKRDQQLKSAVKKADFDQLTRQKAAAARKEQVAAEKLAKKKAAVEKSVKHHEDVAKNLRKKAGPVGLAAKWVKKNPGKSTAIGAAAVGAVGYAAYKHHKNKKKEEK